MCKDVRSPQCVGVLGEDVTVHLSLPKMQRSSHWSLLIGSETYSLETKLEQSRIDLVLKT